MLCLRSIILAVGNFCAKLSRLIWIGKAPCKILVSRLWILLQATYTKLQISKVKEHRQFLNVSLSRNHERKNIFGDNTPSCAWVHFSASVSIVSQGLQAMVRMQLFQSFPAFKILKFTLFLFLLGPLARLPSRIWAAASKTLNHKTKSHVWHSCI